MPAHLDPVPARSLRCRRTLILCRRGPYGAGAGCVILGFYAAFLAHKYWGAANPTTTGDGPGSLSKARVTVAIQLLGDAAIAILWVASCVLLTAAIGWLIYKPLYWALFNLVEMV